ncbi:MAG: Molybdopterin molybdenumtransferase [Chroococcopsis gigantea SAG 12.99]|jgi:molybdopterin molybdotransferase|nr:molybdopterin molybdotransferase MoeA [Chlorogloea purpurea SAG 13.99]MDV3000976.1 Molybdopterin molybdenumtransferase [Chroococcopsis gigantea SAG 12.99]
MLSVKEAEAIVLNLVTALQETESISLEGAHKRILARSISGRSDFPYWDNSAMDGYAVRYEDVKTPTSLEIIEEIPAGKPPEKAVETGQAARIFTGSVMPDGADTVVMQENTLRENDRVSILTPPENTGQFVRKKGDYYRRGAPLLTPGIAINPQEMAILATAQVKTLDVYRRPKVAIFSTGDELISPYDSLGPGQIVDSNQYALRAFVGTVGGIPVPLGIVSDRPAALQATISAAVNSADIVLSTGGVSVGDYDYIEQILKDLGATIHINSVAIQPGKPLTVARFPNGCVYFGIPGNPVSALVCCWRFVQPALKKLCGLKDNYSPIFINAKTLDSLHSKGERELYLWGDLRTIEGEYHFQLASGSHNSANLIHLGGTNALAVVDAGITLIPAGANVKVMLAL